MTTGNEGAKVLQALDVMANIKFGREQLAYIQPKRALILTAIGNDDAHALAAYATQAVADTLRQAGYEGSLSPRALRSMVETDGWNLIDDVVAKRENAAQMLQRKLQTLQGGSQFASQAPVRGPATTTRLHPDRSEPPASAPQRTPDTRSCGSTNGNAPSNVHRHPNAPPVGAQNRDSGARPPAPSRPPPQRHDQSSVRQIPRQEANRGSSNAPSSNQGGQNRKPDQKKVHGGKAALTFEVDITKREEPTVRLEAAKMLDPTARTYDWNNKIAVQLTTAELQHVCALLLGMISKVEYKNHGMQQDKWFAIERQTGEYAGTIKVVVGQGAGRENMCLVQVTSADIGDLVALFMRQCALQMKLDQVAVPAALRTVANAFNEAAEAKSFRSNGGQGQQRAAGGSRR